MDSRGQKIEITHWSDPREDRFSRKRLVRRFVAGAGGRFHLQESAMLADRLLVEVLSDDNRLTEAVDQLGLSVEDKLAFSPVFRVRLPDVSIGRYEQLLGRLRVLGREGGFRVSPDYLTQAWALPDDPHYLANQADLELVGAPAAWDIATGSSNVVVAVIDNGIDADHPDLADNLFTNPFEIPGNDLDDDGNGFVDDVSGWDFHDNDNLPEAATFHGTAMAGIIGAVGNNAVGITGINWQCQLMMLKAGDIELPWSAIIQAIDYVILMREMGLPVTVINNSYGGAIDDPTELVSLEAAVARAREAGLLFVAAAGNNGQDNDNPANPHFYPSDLSLDNVFSIAATNNSDDLAGLSNYGTASVDLAAPGIEIFTTVPGGGFASVSGTSASSARVSGLAGLMLAQNPNLDYLQLKQVITATGDNVLDLLGKLKTPVRIHAGEAMALARLFPIVDWADGGGMLIGPEGADFLLEASASDYDGTVSAVSFYVDGTLLGTDTDGTDGWSWEWPDPAGEGILQIEATDNDGRIVTTDGRPFNVLSSFDYWRFGHWGLAFQSLADATSSADPDQDGLANIWEYAIGGNPLLPSSAGDVSGRPWPVMFTDAGDSLLGFDLRLRTADASLELFLESGNGSLQGLWGAVPVDYLTVDPDPAYPGFARIRIGTAVSLASAPAFIRLRIRLN
jgi:subtilisin family serine protease